MKPTTDKTVQVLKDQFDKLGDVETEANKRDVRETRRKLKQAIHKRERNVAKRQLRDLLTNSEDQE
jgi:hypothetical protein